MNDFYGSRNPSCGDRDKNAVPIIDNIIYENIRANGTGGVDFEGLEQQGITGVSMRNVSITRIGSGDLHFFGMATCLRSPTGNYQYN